MRIVELTNETIQLMQYIVEYAREASSEQIRDDYADFTDPKSDFLYRRTKFNAPAFAMEFAVLSFVEENYDSIDDFVAALTDKTVSDLETWLADAPEEGTSMADQVAWLTAVPSEDNFINDLKDKVVDPDKLTEQREEWDRIVDVPSAETRSGGSPAILPEMGEAEAGLRDEPGSGSPAMSPEMAEAEAGLTTFESNSDLEPSSETDQLMGALDDETLDVIREKFTAAAFFGQNLEKFNVETPKGVMNVLEWLSLPENEGMPDDEVLGWIQATQWFANNAETARNFDMDFFNEGEAGRDALIDTQRDVILREAKLIGLNWLGSNPELLNELATNATRLGYDIYDVRNALQGVNDLGPEELARGMILSNEQSVQDLAAKYYMPIGTEDAYDVAWSIYKGEESLDSVEAMYREQAKGLFPSLSGLIDQGVSMRAYFSPYKQRIGQLLEVPDVDLMNDPRFQSILFPASGQGPLSLSETQKFVRGLPEWQYTQNARNSARQMVDNIGRMFGMVA